MNPDVFSDQNVQRICKERFAAELSVAEVVAKSLQTGTSSRAAVFKTSNGQIWLLVLSQSPMLLDDVQKIVSRMNMEPDAFYPPFGEESYFDRIAADKFKIMFPGKPITGDEDLRYYKKLAPYNPALVRLRQIKGEIRAYDSGSRTWHKVKDYSFSKIKTG